MRQVLSHEEIGHLAPAMPVAETVEGRCPASQRLGPKFPPARVIPVYAFYCYIISFSFHLFLGRLSV